MEDGLDCRQCAAGDQNACARLFQRYEPVIAKQMWRFSRDRRVCEELVQDVFVEAYLSIERYQDRGVPFEHWLRRIATRVGYRYWKKEARRKKEVAIEAAADVAANEEFASPADASAAAKVLHELLARLPAADRLVLTMMYFEECDIAMMAERTGWPRAIVKMRAFRARRRLKKMIEGDKRIARMLESL